MARPTREQLDAFDAVVAQLVEQRGGWNLLSSTERNYLHTASTAARDLGEHAFNYKAAVEIYLVAGAGITSNEAKTIIALIFG